MKSLKTTIFLVTILLLLVITPSLVQGRTAEELNKLISEYQQKLSSLGEQRKSLSSQIQFMDTQIYLTELRIQETEQLIATTQSEIDNLSGKIEGLNTSLDYLSHLLVRKIAESYKRREIPLFNIFIDSDNAQVLANRLKYARVTQENDRRVAFQVQQAKLNFEQQKELREQKKAELDALEAQLESHKNDLDKQKEEKQSLLVATQNDERTYQRLLQQALAESQAIRGALVSGVVVGPVKKGDSIGLVGNTGAPNCSSGAHLHFEVHTNDAWNSWTDPGSYLSQWQSPLSDPVIVTQGYGHTPYSFSYQYSGGIHTGIDMYSTSSDVIRAPADGTLYSSTWGCPNSSNINVKYIDHGGGIKSFYLHVQ